ncbi:glycosyltransferase family 9 protein [Georgenia deserti]|uniref:Glycosyltransferase family 9 protein n=1 Tax=Georgenia deserti TaxID=2093781 RepID=A0ABW4L8X1_9MICO
MNPAVLPGATGAAGTPLLGPGDVLAFRALGLGDALAGVAALRGLRRAFPDGRLVLAAPRATGDWLRELGVVDTVLPVHGLEPPAGGGMSDGGHVAVNLHGRGPQSHRLLDATRPARLVAFGCAGAGHEGPPWRQDEHEVDRWCRLVRSVGGHCSPQDLRLEPPGPRGDDVVIHPGAASGARRWPVDRWRAVARALTGDGLPVVVTGSAAEADLCEAVADACPRARSLAGELDVPGLAALVAKARLVLCGDTGVAHLATAYGTPSVLLFGPTPPQWWGPAIDHDRHTVLWHGEGPGDPHAEELDPALAAITVDEVLAATAELASPPAER